MIEIDSKLAPTWWGQVNPARSFAGSRMALYQGSSNFVLILSNTFSHKITWLIYFSVAIIKPPLIINYEIVYNYYYTAFLIVHN